MDSTATALAPAPRRTPEVREHRLSARDGWSLSVLDVVPEGPARGVVILGHAMMVDRRTLWRKDRRTLGYSLLQAGFRLLVPDFRGHGDSGPLPRAGGNWRYDDLVADTGTYIALAQQLAPGLPIGLVGHSLFGHVALAYLGLHPEAPVHAHVGVGAGIWNKRFEPSFGRWLRKRWVMLVATLPVYFFGYAPTARFGMGSADEARDYWHQMARWVARDRWCAWDGTDYYAAVRKVSTPFLHVLSEGDRLLAHVAGAEAWGREVPTRELLLVGPHSDRPALRGLTPDHMELVTSPRSTPVWNEIAAWLGRKLAR